MLLKKFALPKTDSRLVTVDNVVYKIKLHLVKHPNRDEKSYEEFCSNPEYQEEIEEILIVLLTSEDEPLLPIRSRNLTVYPYKKLWDITHRMQFYRNDILLKTSPYVYYFYIESKLPLVKFHYAETCGVLVRNTMNQAMSHHSKDGQGTTVGSEDNIPQDGSNTGGVEKKNQRQRSKEANMTEPGRMCQQPVKRSHDESESEDNQLTRLNEDVPLGTTKPCKTIKLIPASSMSGPTRKSDGEIMDEAEPKKFSVTEYLDANRHDVQEQDLHEHLRFQELATPAEEKPAICAEKRHGNFHQVLSSVKQLMFG